MLGLELLGLGSDKIFRFFPSKLHVITHGRNSPYWGKDRRMNSSFEDNPHLLNNDQAMFVLDRVQYTPPSPIVTMAVANHISILALDSHRALRIDLGQVNSIEGSTSYSSFIRRDG